MGKRRTTRTPVFFWQGLLIVLPVLVLAVMGGLSLRQDQRLARQEAVDRAQAFVDDLLPRVLANLEEPRTDASAACSFVVGTNGDLLEPRPWADLPIPQPLNTASLNAEQAALWSKICAAEAAAQKPESVEEAYRDFLHGGPPSAFAANAQYALGLLLLKQGRATAAADMFRQMEQSYPQAVAESGLPLWPLAQAKLLEIACSNALPNLAMPAALQDSCSAAVLSPSILTPHLLDLAAQRATSPAERKTVAVWRSNWRRTQWARYLFHALGRRFSPGSDLPKAFWFGAAPTPWADGPEVSGDPAVPDGFDPHEVRALAASGTEVGSPWHAITAQAGASTRSVACLPGASVASHLAPLLAPSKRVPEYLGLTVELAGPGVKWMVASGPQREHAADSASASLLDRRGNTGKAKESAALLASATSVLPGGESLVVSARLANPALLFQRQRARSIWFGWLIAAAAATAMFGLAAAHRAFRRQLQLNELKSNFVSSVSHELRAPISSVRLMAESLERGRVANPEKQQEYFRFIVQECRRLSSLVENVLDFSRIEQGRKEYEFEPTDLVAVVRQTVKLMEPRAEERQVTIAATIPSPDAPLLKDYAVLDGKAVQQALVNLIDNAVKHSPSGATVSVGLELEPTTDRSDQAKGIHLWVEDHGPGIPVAEHEKIFERFYRVGSELRRETQGVGIGLSIVKHVAEAHGGRVLVRSSVGQGSRFTLCLPLEVKEQGRDGRGPSSGA